MSIYHTDTGDMRTTMTQLQEFRRYFDLFDADNDGRLSRHEFKTFLSEFVGQELFQVVNANGDDAISFDECVQLLHATRASIRVAMHRLSVAAAVGGIVGLLIGFQLGKLAPEDSAAPPAGDKPTRRAKPSSTQLNAVRMARIYSMSFDMHPYGQGALCFLVTHWAYAPRTHLLHYMVASSILVVGTNASKFLHKTLRPCQEPTWCCEDAVNNHVSCPGSSDVPSAHSAVGVYFGLLALSHAPRNVLHVVPATYFFLMPVSRYVGKVHSLTAVSLGSCIGACFYYAVTKTLPYATGTRS